MPNKLFTLAILCIALETSAIAQQTGQPPRTWAVIIGISKYQKLPGGQQLQFADRDAALIYEAVQKRGVSPQNVKLLTGVEATSSAIKSAIGNWLARSVSETDTVLIFFSGHGLFEREFGESYLLGYDSDPKDPYSTALSVTELGQALSRRVHSGRVLVIADAVRRDFFDPDSDPNSSKSFQQAFDQLAAARSGLSAIIGSGTGEFSREGQRWGGHGVFAKHLTDVLMDGTSQTSDLAAAAEDLFELLKGRVAEDTSGKQRPWKSGTAIAQPTVARGEVKIASPSAPRPEVSPTTTPQRGVDDKRLDPSRQPEQNIAVNPSITPSRPATEANASSSKPKPVETPSPVERKAAPLEPPIITIREKPAAADQSNEKSSSVARDGREPGSVKNEPPNAAARVEPEAREAPGSRTKPEIIAPVPTSREPEVAPNPPKLAPRREAPPPKTRTVKTTQAGLPHVEIARADIAVGAVPPPPIPTVNPPRTVSVQPEPAGRQPEAVSTSVPAVRTEAAPSPLVLQLEVAITSGMLIEPKTGSAWDLYQRMLSEPNAAADAARLKPALAAALTSQGRAIVVGDVRSDNVSDKVDDFKRAGQMLARARTLSPESGDISALEKLSAAAALISLQFYDEAERALAPLQTAKLAPVENALGLVYQGKLDTWRAERAFKRASEIDAKWATPHYNLALLYRSQQNQAALAEFEAAVSNDQSNVSFLVALGDEYFTRQQWKQASDTFRKAVALKPSDDNLHTKLGHALYSEGLQEEANREYQKAQELRRKRP